MEVLNMSAQHTSTHGARCAQCAFLYGDEHAEPAHAAMMSTPGNRAAHARVGGMLLPAGAGNGPPISGGSVGDVHGVWAPIELVRSVVWQSADSRVLVTSPELVALIASIAEHQSHRVAQVGVAVYRFYQLRSSILTTRSIADLCYGDGDAIHHIVEALVDATLRRARNGSPADALVWMRRTCVAWFCCARVGSCECVRRIIMVAILASARVVARLSKLGHTYEGRGVVLGIIHDMDEMSRHYSLK